ncbi:MAG: restriction endonuclease subunit S [Candidatus Scalindua rubra]|uniref:Putative restriction endonuclease n=1 Tax=Candidatus Scalindua brodae TaxID=237368 RepID=A0A0B0EMA2_9BACT|nr:MAG: putative restriction endonuclease [Candidatus Scalindua brodae]MBZ0108612.1 restriction endonuclease subunit S [Candidatus Scalindua rubra]TWU38180.1 EcoKI restriction-modification system protein HsdS [Candidatus Brocadiaceae bacterium S225]
MRYGTYDKYKKGTLFDVLPAHWPEERIHDIAKIKTSNVDKKSKEDEDVVKLCNYLDVYNNSKIDSSLDFMVATASKSDIKRFTLKRGDVVITKDSEDPFDIGIPALINEDIDGLVCGYHLTIIQSDQERLLGNYLYYALEADRSKHQFTLASNGVTRFGLTQQGTKNLKICVPSLDEQKKIADFLDYKTQQIDQLIEKKKALIEKLNEQRIAVITQAVTKGLDKNAKMKPSGVDWLGDVPEHWEVKRLRFCIVTNPVKSETKSVEDDDLVSFVPMDAVEEYGGMDVGQTKMLEEVYNGYTYFKENDVVVAKITPCFENGKGSIALGLTNGIGFGTTEFHVLRGGNKTNKNFLFYMTISHSFRDIGASEMLGAGGQKRIPENFIKDFRQGIPDINEQEEIVTHIEKKLNRLDNMVRINKEAIDAYAEYRNSLITAAVTGKIDVRDFDVEKDVA